MKKNTKKQSLPTKHAPPVAKLLHGGKNGPMSGARLNIVQSDAVVINRI